MHLFFPDARFSNFTDRPHNCRGAGSGELIWNGASAMPPPLAAGLQVQSCMTRWADFERRSTFVHFDEVVERLTKGLSGVLPGAPAQAVLAPEPRRQWPDGFDPARIRHAAGLLLVFPIHRRAHLVLTVRADTLGRHRGQISLPGGVVDPGETFEQAALREAHEEVALPSADPRILGSLTPLDIPVSGFRLHPVVAVMNRRPELPSGRRRSRGHPRDRVDDLLDRRAWPRASANATAARFWSRRFNVGGHRNLGRDGDGARRVPGGARMEPRAAGIDRRRLGTFLSLIMSLKTFVYVLRGHSPVAPVRTIGT